MKTLEQHNAERRRVHDSSLDFMVPRKNGIACSECGEELYDSHPNLTLTSNPPQKNVHCPKCGFSGYRIA